MPLDSSASEPLRRISTLSGRPLDSIARCAPSPSICAAANTNTTSAMPTAVAIVVTLRTRRLRTL
jgi:hypothetical protein